MPILVFVMYRGKNSAAVVKQCLLVCSFSSTAEAAEVLLSLYGFSEIYQVELQNNALNSVMSLFACLLIYIFSLGI